VSNLVDIYGNLYNKTDLDVFYGTLILTGSPDTSKQYKIPIMVNNLENFAVILPNDPDVNGSYTFSVVLERLPQYAITATAGNGGTVSGGGTFNDGTIVTLTALSGFAT